MTRVTNFGRKRKYLEAGFATVTTKAAASTSSEQPTLEANTTDGGLKGSPVRPKKKRKKSTEQKGGDDEQNPGGDSAGVEGKEEQTNKRKKVKIHGGAKNVAISGFKKRTEQRRLKRISGRQADTVCFACREKGHAARDCPKAAGDNGDGEKTVNTTVGMCYRCGSTKHTLSRCKKPEDPLNPLPFASCFVCLSKGHLASKCPQNQEKGIYPNGGSCKLCGEKTHLAKDCGLRKKDMAGTAASAIFGTGSGAGADEDDFHTFKRKNTAVSKDEKEERRKKRLDVKAGSDVGTVNAHAKNRAPSNPKKVVFF